MICDYMDVLMLFGIVIDKMRKYGCCLSVIPAIIFLDEKFVALSMNEVEYDVVGMTSCEAG